MNPRYHGPAVLPPAAEVKKRVEEHLESLPGWDPEPRERPPSADAQPEPARRPARS
jgi:hypothetical protein